MKIEYYDSAETTPFKRYQKFNKFLSMNAEVGGEPIDLFKRIDRALGYNKSSDADGVVRELSNMKMALMNMLNEYSPKGSALAVMVKSIDGVDCTDISETGLNETLQRMSDAGFSIDDINNKTEEIKKKSRKSLKSILNNGLDRVKRLLMRQ